MDYTPIISQVLKLWWLIPVFLLIGAFKTPRVKGMVGEFLVRNSGRLMLPADRYHPLHNVTLPTPDGTTQIDHILVSRFGVFVIETKHYKGWIYGAEHEARWTQKFPRSSHQFQNPLRQNFKHQKALEEVLGLSSDLIRSVIVFSGESRFKTPMPANVVHGWGYLKYVKSFQQEVLSEPQVQAILARLQAVRLPANMATSLQHTQNLRSRQDPSAERSCPRCGSRMILRTSKQGRNAGSRFWGCSTYPRCRAVQNIA